MADDIYLEYIKDRILSEHVMAQRVIAQFLRGRHNKLKFQFYRKIGLFEATLYLEN